jgi:hypothetical protein
MYKTGWCCCAGGRRRGWWAWATCAPPNFEHPWWYLAGAEFSPTTIRTTTKPRSHLFRDVTMDPVMSCMRCCFSEPVDFDSEVNLFHFDLHKAVGKGALGKVGHLWFSAWCKPTAYHLLTLSRIMWHIPLYSAILVSFQLDSGLLPTIKYLLVQRSKNPQFRPVTALSDPLSVPCHFPDKVPHGHSQTSDWLGHGSRTQAFSKA